ncbi:MAG: hypothetical protein ACR2PH_15175 [Desulfobulbia bacterium]
MDCQVAVVPISHSDSTVAEPSIEYIWLLFPASPSLKSRTWGRHGSIEIDFIQNPPGLEVPCCSACEGLKQEGLLLPVRPE